MNAPYQGAAATQPQCQPGLNLSIVIPHYNDVANLDRCLTDLGQQCSMPGRVEVVVADNNSLCDRLELEAVCRGRARLVDAAVQGAAHARNAGVAVTNGRVLAFIDSDCRPSPTWIAAGLAALRHADMVGGRVEVTVRDPAVLTPAEAFEVVFAFNNERYVREKHFSVTANLFVTREVFDKVGGFRGGVSEDVDWGQRAHALGFRWAYAPDVVVSHPARRTAEDLGRKWRRITAERFALARERPGGRARWIVHNWLMLLSLPLFAHYSWSTGRVSKARDRMNVLRVLVWNRWWRFCEAHRLAFLS